MFRRKKSRPIKVAQNGIITIPPESRGKLFTTLPTFGQLFEFTGGECILLASKLVRVTSTKIHPNEKIFNCEVLSTTKNKIGGYHGEIN